MKKLLLIIAFTPFLSLVQSGNSQKSAESNNKWTIGVQVLIAPNTLVEDGGINGDNTQQPDFLDGNLYG